MNKIMENKKILSDEELKEVAGGISNEYCMGHITEQSCRATHVCQWHPSIHEDPFTKQMVDGWCVSIR